MPQGFSDPTQALRAVINYAVAQVGKPYVKGSTGPDAFDCSGLVTAAFRIAGLDIPAYTYTAVKQGQAVGLDQSQWQPGDLLYMNGDGGRDFGHVVMYLGNGKFVGAQSTAVGTITGNVDPSRIQAVRRMMPNVDYGSLGAISGGGNFGHSGPLSGTEVAQIAYQAGFRGDALTKVVAISQRESSWDPTRYNGNTSTGDNSWGLMQINTIGNMGPSIDKLITQAGGTSRESLKDPLINLKVAFLMSNGGTDWNPWGGYKGMSEMAGTNPQLAQQVVQQASSAGLLGQNWSGSFNSASTPSTTTGSPTKMASVPAGGRLIRNPYDNKTYLFYQGPGGKWMMFDADPSTSDLSGMQTETPSMDEWKNTWDPLQPIHAGDASSLGAVSSSFGSFNGWMDQVLTSVFGQNNPARNDPSVLAVIAQYAARPDMSPAELQNLLQGTDWYNTHTQAQLEWNGLSDAEKQSRTSDTAEKMAATWEEFLGLPVDPGDPRIQNYLQDVASGKMGYGAFTEVVKQQAQQDPNSKYSRDITAEDRARKQDGIDIENTSQKVRDLANTWGVPMSTSGATDWATKIVNKDSSDQDLLDSLKAQAQVLYPWKSPDMDTTTAAQPWIQTYQRVMEKQADLQNPQVQKALTAGQPVYQFEQDLKRTDDWMGTQNARQDLSGRVASLGQKMGFE